MSNLNERILEQVEVVRENLPQGILARVWYPIMRFGVLNANKRKYDRAVAESVLNDSGVQEKLNNRTLFGNQEHPAESPIKLNWQETSHIISEFKVDEDKGIFYAAFDILPTEPGKFINILLEAGSLVGVSTRADGELEEALDEDGSRYHRVIPESYRFQTVDFTGDPSTPDAIPEKIISAVKSHYESTDPNQNISKRVAVALLERVKTSASKELEKLINEDYQDDSTKLAHGKVCSVCGKKVTTEESGSNKSSCCGASVVDESINENVYLDIEALVKEMVLDGKTDEEIKQVISAKYPNNSVLLLNELLPEVIVRTRQELQESINEVVKQEGSQWFVYSHKGKKLSKGYGTKEEATKRLRQIEFFKHKNESKVRSICQFLKEDLLDYGLDPSMLIMAGHNPNNVRYVWYYDNESKRIIGSSKTGTHDDPIFANIVSKKDCIRGRVFEYKGRIYLIIYGLIASVRNPTDDEIRDIYLQASDQYGQNIDHVVSEEGKDLSSILESVTLVLGEKLTTSADISGQPANAKSAEEDVNKSAARSQAIDYKDIPETTRGYTESKVKIGDKVKILNQVCEVTGIKENKASVQLNSGKIIEKNLTDLRRYIELPKISYGNIVKENISKLQEVQDVREEYGDQVVQKAGSQAHFGNVIGVFWYNSLSGDLDYQPGNFDHAKFSNREDYIKTDGMVRGRVVKDNASDKTFIFVYTDDFGREVPGSAINDLYNKITDASKEHIRYVVDELGRDLVEMNLHLLEKGESAGDLVSLSDEELLQRYKSLASDEHQEVNKEVEMISKEIQKRGLEGKVMEIGEGKKLPKGIGDWSTEQLPGKKEDKPKCEKCGYVFQTSEVEVSKPGGKPKTPRFCAKCANESKVSEDIDTEVESLEGKRLLSRVKKFVANKGNSYEQQSVYNDLMRQTDTLQTIEAQAIAKYLKKNVYDDRSKQNEVKVSEKAVATAEPIVNNKIKDYIQYNWKLFLSELDAIKNVANTFKISPEEAQQYIKEMENELGKISAAYAGTNEKIESSDSNTIGLSERLASATAERDQLVNRNKQLTENYQNDTVRLTNEIEKLKEENIRLVKNYSNDSVHFAEEIRESKKVKSSLQETITKTCQELVSKDSLLVQKHEMIESINKEVISRDISIKNLKEQLTSKTNEVNKLNETIRTNQKSFEKKIEEKVKEITETKRIHQEEVKHLKEKSLKEKIKLYVGIRTKGMGLKLHENVLTLLESSRTVEEVDELIKRVQDEIREGLTHSVNSLTEIRIEKPTDGVQSDINDKVGTVLKHLTGR